MFFCFHSYILSLSLMTILYALFVAFICSVISNFATPWTAALQASLSFTISWNLLKLTSISSSVTPFSSCLQSFPSSGSFPVSWLFASGGQSVGASASVLAMNSELTSFRIDWFELAVQGTLKSLLQHHTSKALILWSSVFFMVHCSHLDVTTEKP